MAQEKTGEIVVEQETLAVKLCGLVDLQEKVAKGEAIPDVLAGAYGEIAKLMISSGNVQEAAGFVRLAGEIYISEGQRRNSAKLGEVAETMDAAALRMDRVFGESGPADETSRRMLSASTALDETVGRLGYALGSHGETVTNAASTMSSAAENMHSAAGRMQTATGNY